MGKNGEKWGGRGENVNKIGRGNGNGKKMKKTGGKGRKFEGKKSEGEIEEKRGGKRCRIMRNGKKRITRGEREGKWGKSDKNERKK